MFKRVFKFGYQVVVACFADYCDTDFFHNEMVTRQFMVQGLKFKVCFCQLVSSQLKLKQTLNLKLLIWHFHLFELVSEAF